MDFIKWVVLIIPGITGVWWEKGIGLFLFGPISVIVGFLVSPWWLFATILIGGFLMLHGEYRDSKRPYWERGEIGGPTG